MKVAVCQQWGNLKGVLTSGDNFLSALLHSTCIMKYSHILVTQNHLSHWQETGRKEEQNDGRNSGLGRKGKTE